MTFSDETIQMVWDKGRGTADREASIWRKDECGAWIRREHYGNKSSEYGWRIQNVSPGGPDEVGNLRPFHLLNSFDRNAGKTSCHLTADREDIQPTAQVDTPHNRKI